MKIIKILTILIISKTLYSESIIQINVDIPIIEKMHYIESKLIHVGKIKNDKNVKSILNNEELYEKSNDVQKYFIGRLYLITGKVNSAKRIFLKLSGSKVIAPEAIAGLLEIARIKNDKADINLYTQILGELLPLSIFGLDNTRYEIIKNSGDTEILKKLEKIPAINTEKFRSICKSVIQMKDCSLADFAIEAIYSGYTIEWIKDENNNSWLSQMSLPYWLEIGICKKKVNLRESEEYLTKVAIFGDEKISQKAFQKLQTSICESPKCIDNLIVVNNLSKLIVYYKQMNVHPRALFLLNKYNEKINHKYNSEMIKKEWNEKITNYQKLCKDNCFLFGKKLESHNYIDIPFPGNNTVLKNVKKKLDKYVN